MSDLRRYGGRKLKDNQVRQQARPKRNNYYANDNKKSYNKNNYQARGRRPMPRRKPSSVKIIPLGGLGQIGMNITAFECNNQILIVDCGLAFPDEDMLGIDLVIPDITYLKDNASKIRGLVITHGSDSLFREGIERTDLCDKTYHGIDREQIKRARYFK